MKPTVIGSSSTPSFTSAPVPIVTGVDPASVLANFPVPLEPAELAAVQQKASSVSIVAMPLQQIATLEQGPELDLNKVLDGFLSRIDVFDNPQIFKLFSKLGEDIDKEKLPDLANRIMNHEPSLLEKGVMLFQSAKARKHAIDRFWEETQGLVKGSSSKLTKAVHDMERNIETEKNKLSVELTNLDQLVEQYKRLFRDFAVSVAFMQIYLQKAKDELAQKEAAADPNDQVAQNELIDLRDKISALESRALALEGSLTRLPSDSMVIRQLQAAGISTLQEVSTTALARFISIKQTLVTLNATMVTKSVQNAAEAGKHLDENLTAVRGALMKDVVTTSANAPGDNRKAQAEQILAVVEQTKIMRGIVDQARQTNEQKFGEARNMFATARQEMLALGQR